MEEQLFHSAGQSEGGGSIAFRCPFYFESHAKPANHFLTQSRGTAGSRGFGRQPHTSSTQASVRASQGSPWITRHITSLRCLFLNSYRGNQTPSTGREALPVGSQRRHRPSDCPRLSSSRRSGIIQPHPAPLWIFSPIRQDSGRAGAGAIRDQTSRQQGSMSTTGQQQGGGLRSRRSLGREKDPGQGVGMEAACWLAPGVLRRLIELPSPPLSRHQLKRLEEHRYSSAGRSLLEPLMQCYWEWLVGRVPAWIAPNLITIIGLATNVFTTLVLVYYCPTATEQAPLWAYLLCAVGLFIYQSLDAIDGKQARRTNSSSPLGELFDHGCDSLSTVFVVLGTSIAVQMGTNPDWMFFCCFAGMFMFYCAHWQTYVSGTLRFGIIDVTEVQLFIIIMYLLAAVGGSALWQSLIPVLNIQMKMIPAICTFLGAIFSCTNYFRVIFTGGVGKNGSTIAGTSVLSPVLHIGSVIILAVMIYKKSAVQLFEKHPCLYILAFGFVSAKITNKLVVAHMTKSEMHLHDLAFLGPGLLFLDQYFNSFIDEYLVLWIALFISFFDLVRYCVSVCNQIACHLHIFVFKIKPCSVLSSAPH